MNFYLFSLKTIKIISNILNKLTSIQLILITKTLFKHILLCLIAFTRLPLNSSSLLFTLNLLNYQLVKTHLLQTSIKVSPLPLFLQRHVLVHDKSDFHSGNFGVSNNSIPLPQEKNQIQLFANTCEERAEKRRLNSTTE